MVGGFVASDMSEEQTSFKVTDRRLFNPDGSPRELTPEERHELAAAQAPPAKPVAEAQPATTNPPTDISPGAEARTIQSSIPETQGSEESAEDIDELDAGDPASLVNFLMSIASNAASALGMMEHPVTHQREVDLELAKHWIDVLGMLQQKTKGNVTSQEQQILEGFLSDLRMQFVSLANSPQAKSARSYTGRDIIGGK
jgi:hypothetical protein